MQRRALAAWSLALALAFAACGLKSAPQFSHGLGEVTVLAADAGQDAGMPFVDDGGCSCAAWGGAQNAGLIADTELVELSGLAASRAHPGVYWAHNDSGDSARFFAMNATGGALGRFSLPNAVAHDIEDIAVGPCPQGTCVYLGDIGDNLTVRDDYTVYRIAEPAIDADAGTSTIDVTYEHFDYRYPNGEKHNAETLLVHPVTGELYVVTKHGTGIKSRVYRFPQPLNPAAQVELTYLGELPVPASGDLPLSGGDISPCGNALLLRMYNRVVELRMAPGQGFESVFSASVRPLPTPVEVQGEAVTWSLDGKSFFTASEGTGQTLHRVDCP